MKKYSLIEFNHNKEFMLFENNKVLFNSKDNIFTIEKFKNRLPKYAKEMIKTFCKRQKDIKFLFIEDIFNNHILRGA